MMLMTLMICILHIHWTKVHHKGVLPMVAMSRWYVKSPISGLDVHLKNKVFIAN